MHARLASIDPDTAARLAPNDAQRIQRAMEIYMLTGKPMAELLKAQYVDSPDTPIKLALVPSDREALHRRIEDPLRRHAAARSAG